MLGQTFASPVRRSCETSKNHKHWRGVRGVFAWKGSPMLDFAMLRITDFLRLSLFRNVVVRVGLKGFLIGLSIKGDFHGNNPRR